MKPGLRLWRFIAILLLAGPPAHILLHTQAASPPNKEKQPASAALKDETVTITSAAAARAALRRQIWGEANLPRTQPTVTSIPRSDPEWTKITDEMGLGNSSEFERVEKLSFALAAGQSAIGYHFVPKGGSKRLVIVHQGHGCTFGPPGAGLQRLVGELLRNGYSVVTLYMPRPAVCKDHDLVSYHQELFQKVNGKLYGSPLQLFVEPVARTVNYALKSGYSRVDLIGLSGGGWTTTLYAAIDPRIRLSIPVAGTFPRPLPCGINTDDPEQNAIASYLNLYVLGSLGRDRRQIQILNEYDACCFKVRCDDPPRDNEPAIRNYERLVAEADRKLGGGSFTVHIDYGSRQHQISADVVRQVILPALRQ